MPRMHRRSMTSGKRMLHFCPKTFLVSFHFSKVFSAAKRTTPNLARRLRFDNNIPTTNPVEHNIPCHPRHCDILTPPSFARRLSFTTKRVKSSGTVTSRKAKLHLSSAVSQCRSALTCDGKRSSPSMAAACLQRSNPAQWGFPRQAAAGNHSKDNSKASLGTVVGKIVTALADKLDEVRDAVSSNSGCAVVLVRRGISVSVPRGRRVSEKIWRELEAGCKVSVSSHVVVSRLQEERRRRRRCGGPVLLATASVVLSF